MFVCVIMYNIVARDERDQGHDLKFDSMGPLVNAIRETAKLQTDASANSCRGDTTKNS
jgi:hypothetical protein